MKLKLAGIIIVVAVTALASGDAEGLFSKNDVQGVPVPGTVGADPFAGYEPSSGPILSVAHVKRDLLQDARTAGDRYPQQVMIVATQLSEAMHVLGSAALAGQPMSPGFARWLASDVYVVEMQGRFRLSAVSVPKSIPSEQRGTVLDVIVDAHTDHVDGFRLSDGEPPIALKDVGPVDRFVRQGVVLRHE